MTDCAIIRDLMLLEEGGEAGEASRALVEQHVRTCEACRAHRERLRREAAPLPPERLAAPWAKVRRRLHSRRAYTALLWAAVAVLALTTSFAWLTRPAYFSWEDAGVALYASQDGGGTFVAASPASGVTRLSVEACAAPAGETAHLEVTAWTTPLDRLTHRGFAAALVEPGLPVYYIDCANDGTAVALAGSEDTNGGFQALPRLTLGYYALLAAGAAVVLALAWLILRRRSAGRIAAYVLAVPLCYLAAHVLVMGLGFLSFDLLRDFALMLLDALALYLAFFSLMRLRREA